MLHRVSAKLFSLRRSDAAPSTQFAATIVAMPDLPPEPETGAARSDGAGPDSFAPDSVGSEGSGAHAAVPDIVTDIGGLPTDAPDPADAPTLSHIGRYALKRQLGAGGLGTVFEAWDPLLSRAVAVKTLQFDVDPQERHSLDGLFLNEARAAAGLNHRYIVTIHDAGLSPHGVYIAMERLYGRDLQRAIAAGWRPSVEQTVQLIRRVNEALAYAHARGVVHCDIKPANIFLQRRDKPKVLDFGIARILNGGQLPALDGALVGSPRYRAPEQLQGGTIDARTDLFSLGVVMYELLTGRRAFPGDTLAEINHAVLETDPPPAHEVEPTVPRELSAMVARLMARAPADRYTCASELNADLRRWIVEHTPGRDLTMPAGRALVAAQPTAAPARSPLARWLLAGGLVLAAAAAIVSTRPMWATRSAVAPSAALPAPLPATAATPAAPEPPAPAALPAATATAEPSAETAAAAAPATAEPVAPTPALADANATRSAAAPVRALPAARAAPDRSTRARPAAPDALARDARRTEEARAAAPLPAAPAATGQVQIAVSPWAEIEVDGRPQGTTPPLARLSLPEGTYRITLRNGDFAPHTVQVQVSAERPVTLRHRFGS